MGDLSRNFSSWEFVCGHCGARRGPTPALLNVLQRMRDVQGRSLRIVSGYRCPEHNRAVGGIRNSEHLSGNAADVVGGYATVAQWHGAGAIGVGTRRGKVIHVDCANRLPFTFRE